MITTPLKVGKSEYDWRALVGTATVVLAVVFPEGVLAESVKDLLPHRWETLVADALARLRAGLVLLGALLAALGKPVLVEDKDDA